MAHRTPTVLTLAVSLLLAAGSARAQLPFFPGAEGYGGSFLGSAPSGGWFSNGTVYHVTNLNDSGPGSLRGAFQENTSNKVIVFDVGGVIRLTSGSLDIKNLQNYYIAGQTAPSPVTIVDDNSQVTHSNNKVQQNVILRYLTFRKGTGNGEDALSFAGGGSNGIASNMIFDHVSASWAEDENLSIANWNTNITVQYSIIADALTTGHAYGSLVRPQNDANVTMHHNLYANNASRQPRLGTYNGATLTADVRNNVVYNWRDRATYAGGSSEPERESVEVNYVGNYLVAGPSTAANTTKAFIIDKNTDVSAYQSGNFIDPDKLANPGGAPNGSDTGWGMFQVNTGTNAGTLTQLAAPVATSPVTTQSATAAFDQVIDYAGNFWWGREAIDARIVNNVVTNTNPPNGVAAAAPNAAELAALNATPMTTRPVGYDSDNDGMPDQWERTRGFNPALASDWNQDHDGDGYLNLLEFINERGEFPAPTALVFDATTGSSRFDRITNWRTVDPTNGGTTWQPGRFDTGRIAASTVTVTTAGQRVGRLELGDGVGAAGGAGEGGLLLSAGWLAAHDRVVLAPDGRLALSGTGQLVTPLVERSGAGGALELSGGTLRVGRVDFGVVNQGATIAPSPLTVDPVVGLEAAVLGGVGATTIGGDLTLGAGGTLAIDLAGAASFDTLAVEGAAQLGGTLSVAFAPGYAPASGSWPIATATGGFSGAFSSITAGFAVQRQGTTLNLLYNIAPSLDGDFNGDGQVDAADYVVWRDNPTAPAGDYTLWTQNFGASASGAATQAAPEPAAWLLAFVLTAPLGSRRR